ncbi:MAG: Fic family protein [Chloroflexi bacterium]|nr:Fic family protein [Chloroflexota bacterium]
MRREQFQDGATGELARIGEGWAFVPAPLPPELAFSRELLLAVEAARGAIGELVGQARLIANADLIVHALGRREAVLSSRIEGTQTEIAEVLLHEATVGRPEDEDSDLHEVLNYVATLNVALEWHGDGRDLDLSLIKELHQRLMLGVRGRDRSPGLTRQRLVYIGSAGQGIAEARFVPPPPEQVGPLLEDLVRFLQGPAMYGPLIDSALAHYQFEAIHPFQDGNGRLGRLLIPLHLQRAGVLDRPLLYLAAYLEKRRDEYVERLLRVSTDGDWTGWVLFFLRGLEASARDAIERVRRVMEIEARYRSLVAAAAKSPMPLRMLGLVMQRLFVSVGDVMERTGTTAPTARAAIDVYVAQGILKPYRRIRGRQYWLATELLERVYED